METAIKLLQACQNQTEYPQLVQLRREVEAKVKDPKWRERLLKWSAEEMVYKEAERKRLLPLLASAQWLPPADPETRRLYDAIIAFWKHIPPPAPQKTPLELLLTLQ